MLPPMRIYTTRNDIKYLLVEHDEVISDHIKRDGVWGSDYLDTCAKILRNVPSGRVIDVGASIGTWTVPLALMFEGKHEFDAIEPLSKVNMQLNANVLLNNLENVNVHRVAISDVTETYVAEELEVFNIMKVGTKNRSISATNMNEESSRSHSIFILTVTQNKLEDLS